MFNNYLVIVIKNFIPNYLVVVFDSFKINQLLFQLNENEKSI